MRAYESKDYEQVASWFKARSMPAPLRGDFPAHGFIVEKVAAGFLLQTDTPCAILDFFIANPDASRRNRRESLDQITLELISLSRHLGYRAIKCDTQLVAIREAAQRNGFRLLGEFSSFIKGL